MAVSAVEAEYLARKLAVVMKETKIEAFLML